MQNKEDIKIIGVTGGTGSGKSTVASIMKDFGGIIIDADKVYDELIQKDQIAYKAILGCFGEEILDEDGEIDRKKLGRIVFNDKEKLKKLSNLTHKHVGDEIHKRTEQIKNQIIERDNDDLAFIVLDVPVPVEYGFFDIADRIFSVIANDDIRVERLMKRSGISEEEAEKRIYSQLSNSEYAGIGDVVIINESDPENLKKNVAKHIGKIFGYDF